MVKRKKVAEEENQNCFFQNLVELPKSAHHENKSVVFDVRKIYWKYVLHYIKLL